MPAGRLDAVQPGELYDLRPLLHAELILSRHTLRPVPPPVIGAHSILHRRKGSSPK
jgi:hypothetical protein